MKDKIKLSPELTLQDYVNWAQSNNANLNDIKVEWLWTKEWPTPEPFFVINYEKQTQTEGQISS